MMGGVGMWDECPHGILYKDSQKVACELCDRDKEIFALKARVEELETLIGKAAPIAWIFHNAANHASDWEKEALALLKKGE